jgi:hypothetical protein
MGDPSANSQLAAIRLAGRAGAPPLNKILRSYILKRLIPPQRGMNDVIQDVVKRAAVHPFNGLDKLSHTAVIKKQRFDLAEYRTPTQKRGVSEFNGNCETI